MWSSQLRLTWVAALAAASALGCVREVLPAPANALGQWSDAVHRGDAQAIHKLLTDKGQQAHTVESIRAQLDRLQDELKRTASDSLATNARTQLVARLEGPPGWAARLVSNAHKPFRIESAIFPSAAFRPRDALRELRLALEHKSYLGLRRVLTTRSAQALDSDMSSLLRALHEPEATSVEVRGRRATVQLPGGHRVNLEREDGFWKVRDFD